MGTTAYPEILTKAKWDKEKGFVAKIIKGETGIGAMLEDLKKSYDAIPWAKLDDGLPATAKTPDAAAKILTEGKAVLNGQIDATRKKAIEGSRLATKVAADLKKSPLTPKSTREFLDKVSNAAVNFSSALRDEAIETLKKFEAGSTDFAATDEEIKTRGEAYMQNRKLALTQMNQLKNLFIETRTRVNTMAATSEKLANGALANTTTAGKAVTDITALHDESVRIVKAANDRYGKDGSVNTNEVQRTARGNIAKIQGKKQYDVLLTAYQQKSAGDFNAIMAVVAEILTMAKELDSGVAGIATSLDIARDASTIGTKSLAEHQQSARDAVKTAMDQVAKAKEELDKIGKRVPLLKSVLNDAKTKPETLVSGHSTFETSVNELNRRVSAIAQAANKVANLQKRLSVLPQNVQNDPVVKGEAAKLAGIYKNFQAAIKQAQDGATQAEKLQTELPPKP